VTAWNADETETANWPDCIFRACGPVWSGVAPTPVNISLGQFKVMSAVEHCRTAALGGHVEG